MADKFTQYSDSPYSPARSATAVTPHDSNALANIPKGLYVGSPGDLTVRLVDDSADVVIKNAPTGYHPIRVQYVRATGTTATNIVALF